LGRLALVVPTRKIKKDLERIIFEHTREIHELQLISLFEKYVYNQQYSKIKPTTQQFLLLQAPILQYNNSAPLNQTYEVLFIHKIHGRMDETESPN
jgi:hypothetical protein